MKHKRILILGCLVLLSGISSISTLAAPKNIRVSSTEHPIQTLRAEWTDSSRKRTVPYKIYYPSDVKTPVPVIIFSHGLGGSRDNYEYLGKGWSGAGFVAVHLQHPGSDIDIWKKGSPRLAFMKAGTPRNAEDRALDAKFALDELVKMNTNGALKNRLDLGRVGMAGHSFGANTTLLLSGQKFGMSSGKSFLDGRIKAAIPMSAPPPHDKSNLKELYDAVKIPMLHMTGTEDYSRNANDTPAERLLPYQNTTAKNHYLLVFEGGDHMVFSGRRKSEDPKQASQDKLFQSLILQSSIAFWNAYLKNDSKSQNWLRSDFKTVLAKSGTWEYR